MLQKVYEKLFLFIRQNFLRPLF